MTVATKLNHSGAAKVPSELKFSAGVVGSPDFSCGGACGPIDKVTLAVLFLSIITLYGCQDLVPRDTSSPLSPRLLRSEIIGFMAGLGTTCAALPDLLAMLRRRSAAGMNPRMAAIMGVFQILWVYYGLLILSRPGVAWNVIAILIISLSVAAYFTSSIKKRQTTQ
jgi:MtN3 and saliva related transmembrane protein